MINIKSPYKLSQELNISSTAVYKKIKQLDNELKPHIKKENNKIFLNEEAERIIRDNFSEVIQPVDEQFDNQLSNEFDKLYNKFDSEIEYLREQNRLLQEQNKSLQDELRTEREHSRQQADRTTEIAERLTKLNENQQILLLSEQKKNTPLISDTTDTEGVRTNQENRKGIFAKIFSKKNR